MVIGVVFLEKQLVVEGLLKAHLLLAGELRTPLLWALVALWVLGPQKVATDLTQVWEVWLQLVVVVVDHTPQHFALEKAAVLVVVVPTLVALEVLLFPLRKVMRVVTVVQLMVTVLAVAVEVQGP